MAPKTNNKKESSTSSPPKLRKRKNSQPSTSTPLPSASRKRKSSLTGELCSLPKKSAEQQNNNGNMIRSPATTTKGKKDSFRLEPAILKVGRDTVSPEATAGPLDDLSMATEGYDLDKSAADLLLENSGANLLLSQDAPAATESSNTQANQSRGAASGSKQEDPFEKLHNLMALNFASIKSDNSVMSGQLGLLQNNVVGLSTTVENLKTDVCGMNTRLSSVAAQAVTNKCGITNINKKLNELKDQTRSDIRAQVASALATELKNVDLLSSVPNEISDKLSKLDKEMDKIRAVQTVQQMSANSQRNAPRQSAPTLLRGPEDESRQYWAARRRIRCSPIAPGNSRNDMLKNTDDFLHDKLGIPEGELQSDSIVNVQRLPGKKKQKIQNEVLITFDSVQTRDCVASYASNLSRFDGDPSLRPGLKLEIPDHLCGVFRVLERYAHTLKGQNPGFFKRSIKYDDVNLSLVLDYCTTSGGDWQRANFEEAAASTRSRAGSYRSSSSSVPDERGPHQSQLPGTEDEENMDQQM